MIANLNATNFWVQFIAGAFLVAGGVWGVIKWATHRLAELAKDKSGVIELVTRLDRIEAQYRNNGGSSMKDAIDRIERSVNEVRVDQVKLALDLARHEGLHEGLKGE